MGKLRVFLLSALLLWTSLMGACRTTEGQLYSPSYIPTGPYTAVSPEAPVPVRPGSASPQIPFLVLATVILIGLIMVFASDKKPKKKKTSPPVRSRRSAKKAKKTE